MIISVSYKLGLFRFGVIDESHMHFCNGLYIIFFPVCFEVR